MQRSVRIQEQQLLFLAERARQEVAKSKSGLCYSGVMSKRSGDSGKWQQRWFLLHQNLLFYFDNINSSRPAGVIFLEGSYCDRAIVSSPRHKEKDGGDNQQHCFVISYRKEGLKQYEFSTDSEASCSAWVDAITQASFNKILQQKEELEQKHLHLLHIVESEKTSKWQLRQQCDDQATEITKLRTEVYFFQTADLDFPLRQELTALQATSGRTRVMSHLDLRVHSRTALTVLRTLKRHERSSSGGSTKFHVSDFHPRFVADHSDEAAQQLASTNPDLDDLKKIQKVQSFFRGWLCRRRWKQIVEEYIRSPHAENMRKRNSLVFAMVECEQEYVQQIQMLVTCFFRPLKMAASSKNPPINHEDVNSIFLNSETIFFLHQIFMKGLMARMENWPTLVLGDLFDMLLPMLSIYQEYVRNHHYSLQVLAECKQQAEFAALLRRLEEKVQVQGRSLEQFLTYPMNQIPRYIVTLHELLAHTPHDHVERKSLEYAKNRLEELSRIMHDEVSETENIRKNLGIERMICEGCDILLDVNQVFVRQGTLVHVLKDGSKSARGSRFTRSIGTSDKSEVVRQCFLFTNHLIITSRSTTNGKLHLAKTVGKIALHEVTLIEDTCEMNDEEDQGANTNGHTDASHMTGKSSHVDYYQNRDFKIIIDQKPAPLTVHLVAATEEEKVAWTADILQCLENLRCSDLLNAALNEASSVTMPNSIKNDPKLFRDDIDIRFSRSLNSCKVPQIRYATLERLIERLTDLRFLSVDFLNTFLLTYRIFTNSMFVLHALIKVYQSAETLTIEEISRGEVRDRQHAGSVCYSIDHGDGRDGAESGADRRISTVSAPPLEGDDVGAMQRNPHWRWSFRKYEEQQRGSVRIRKLRPDTIPSPIPASPCSSTDHQDSVDEPQEEAAETSSPKVQRSKLPADAKHLVVPGKQFLLPAVTPVPLVPQPSTTAAQVNGTASSEKRPSVSSVGDPKAPSKSGETDSDSEIFYLDSVSSRSTRPVRTIQIPPPLQISQSAQVSRGPASGPGGFSTLPSQQNKFNKLAPRRDIKRPYSPMDIASVLTSPNLARKRESNVSDYTGLSLSPRNSLRQPDIIPKGSQPGKRGSTTSDYSDYLSPRNSMLSSCDPRIPVQPSKRGSNVSDVSGYASSYRSSVQFSEASRNSLFASGDPNAPNSGKVGAVVTSSRRSGRRCSSAIAAAAFAVATAASANPPDMFDEEEEEEASRARRSSIICAAATMRVLNVMRHWVSKQRQDFETDLKLREAAVKFLQDVVCDFNLIPAEQKLAGQILRTLTTGGDEPSFAQRHAELERILTPPQGSTRDNTYSALEIAEQMTLLDHKIFMAIRSEEFLCMAWMKEDKGEKAPNILLITKRFNETSRLVVSEIIGCATVTERISVIEKWTAVADICRVLHNYNGVLQICAALVNSSVYRLKRTWQKLSKTTKLTIDKLQTLVASDGRFKNMREALHRCDPPCVPYLGMYLTDLSFIEEGTPNYAENGMINFSKMRMIAHVVQEIKLYQQSPYKIQHSPRVTAYLLDATRLMAEDELYRRSLMIEPRTARMSVDIPTGPAPTAPSGPVTPQPARGGREAKLQTQTSFPG